MILRYIKIWSVLISLSLSTFSSAQEKSSIDKTYIDSIISLRLKEWNVVGASISIVKDGETIYNEGHGFRNLEDSLEITPSTIFAMGSSAKAFTGALIAQSDTDSLLYLERPVSEQVNLNFGNAYLTNNITFKDLLTHNTGIPGHDFVWLSQELTREELFEIVPHLPVSFGLREKFQYNNILFALAGYAAAKLKDQSWEEAIQEMLFDPLQMDNTTFSIPAVDSENYALSYHYNGFLHMVLPFRDLSLVAPAGGVYTTSTDLSHWLQMLLQKGQFNEQRVLDPETFEKLFHPYVVSTFPRKFEEQFYENYGLGWMITNYRGKHHIHHAGNIDGFTSTVDIWPDQKLGITILTNSSYANSFTDVVKYELADYILGLKKIDWNSRFEKAMEKSKGKQTSSSNTDKDKIKSPELSEEDFMKFEGKYSHGAYGDIILTRKGQILVGNHGKFPLQFEPVNDHTLKEITIFQGQKFVFSEYVNGLYKSVESIFPSSEKPVIFKRVFKDLELNKS